LKEVDPYRSQAHGFSVPEQNIRAFVVVYGLENALRELIVEELAKLSGPRWYKHRLPGDILKKYIEAVQLQRQIHWAEIIPHHPIYYVDFPDLKKVIERQDNWDGCFCSVFGRRDLISATLSELEPIRNSLAHNRKITVEDLSLLESSSAKIASAIGPERFSQLASRTSTAHTIREDLEDLRVELDICSLACAKCQTLGVMSVWLRVKQEWWFDETYLGHPTEAIETCFDLLGHYASLPRHRGQGHVIESWVRTSGVSESSKLAAEAIHLLVETSR